MYSYGAPVRLGAPAGRSDPIRLAHSPWSGYAYRRVAAPDPRVRAPRGPVHAVDFPEADLAQDHFLQTLVAPVSAVLPRGVQMCRTRVTSRRHRNRLRKMLMGPYRLQLLPVIVSVNTGTGRCTGYLSCRAEDSAPRRAGLTIIFRSTRAQRAK